jgi:hypothetical protein
MRHRERAGALQRALARRVAKRFGSFRDRVRHDLIERPAYAFGLLAAADLARHLGIARLTAVELGVAGGDGLLNLCELAVRVGEETGVAFDVVGFDTGGGLPAPRGPKDHPEVWVAGDFPMRDREHLAARLPEHGRLILGDVRDTLDDFVASLSDAAPLGFVSNDLDLYSSTAASFALFGGAPTKYLPATLLYFDDTLGAPSRMGSLFRNRWCGQLAAIGEFNARAGPRKIDALRILPYRRPGSAAKWMAQSYALHVLDHPLRQEGRVAAPQTVAEQDASADASWPF